MPKPTLSSDHVDDIKRHRIPECEFPISAAVEVPAGKTLVYLSGNCAFMSNPDAHRESIEAYGKNTEEQTVAVFRGIRQQLADMNLGLGDIVKMQVFLVGTKENAGRMDFAGFMAGYNKFFGTPKQPRLPARSTVQVAALSNPGFLVEIEAIAVRP
jgi:enamine deaminase RidA (YjgF/YER057c/UK114 family)